MVKDPGPEPRAKLPTWKRTAVYALALVFDAVKFVFGLLIFFGPAILGTVVASWVGDWLGDGIGEAIGWAAALAAGTVGGPALVAAGVILALATSFLGWLVMLGFFVIAVGIKETGEVWLTMFFGFAASEVPIVDIIIPTFLITTWRIVRKIHKKDKRLHKEWQTKRDAFVAEERRVLALRIQQINQTIAENEAREASAEEEREADAKRTLEDQYAALSFRNTAAVDAGLRQEQSPRIRESAG